MDGQVRCLRSKALLVFWLICVSVVSIEMVEVPESGSTSGVYIVYTELPQGEPRAHHLKTLASIVGSEQAARDALLYVYTHAATGFSAKLTKDQAAEMSKQPGVLSVQPSMTYQLASGSRTGGLF
ncbi:uncharacterized protein [Bemisia tabaci]|uniref:uncharacterized protein n=1 Tax=Bemisia tabaci TaxID=7038 RepID=UPI003B282BD0